MENKIIIISGATGTGKTSTAGILTENAPSRLAVHLHTDDFYQYIKRGYIAPWLEEAGDQNETVAEVIAASARSYAEGGYEVYVDGVIGPWFLKPWQNMAGFSSLYGRSGIHNYACQLLHSVINYPWFNLLRVTNHCKAL